MRAGSRKVLIVVKILMENSRMGMGMGIVLSTEY